MKEWNFPELDHLHLNLQSHDRPPSSFCVCREADWVCVWWETACTREQVCLYVIWYTCFFSMAAGTGGLQWVLSKCSGVKATPSTTTHPLCPPPNPEYQRVLYELICSEYQLVACSLHLPKKHTRAKRSANCCHCCRLCKTWSQSVYICIQNYLLG